MSTTSISTVTAIKLLLLSLGGIALVSGLSGCAGDRYTQSTGERIDDHGDSSRVRKALSADTQYKYGDVSVQTFKGVVQLSGFVNSRDQKNRAGELAKNVDGIKQVTNNITVKESAN
jgi:osmotically-inducible protein OsmY